MALESWTLSGLQLHGENWGRGRDGWMPTERRRNRLPSRPGRGGSFCRHCPLSFVHRSNSRVDPRPSASVPVSCSRPARWPGRAVNWLSHIPETSCSIVAIPNVLKYSNLPTGRASTTTLPVARLQRRKERLDRNVPCWQWGLPKSTRHPARNDRGATPTCRPNSYHDELVGSLSSASPPRSRACSAGEVRSTIEREWMQINSFAAASPAPLDLDRERPCRQRSVQRHERSVQRKRPVAPCLRETNSGGGPIFRWKLAAR
ncbi:hypothetical protein BDP55DRAFT_219565 [Colletotrichum godetiae]|uniref:Uncharacterized protein n=1 Tax=Colletotrichum godetiae TaxID=1209918 RepID=A0AAJ0AGP7_9PEZI|nr:uncharacterized protein BDP55DRAFT_219565 [Colletotrichum godetiae]KAK1673575.1 hypothetical protein BDP55DRAFT_219565 [Colletotrichum godetiae]